MIAGSGWLQLADITLSSGRRSCFKVECDDLTDEEVAAMCALLVKMLPPFGSVSGVPTGGVRLEEAMRPYVTSGRLLIIDDVWTTGGSMQSHWENLGVAGRRHHRRAVRSWPCRASADMPRRPVHLEPEAVGSVTTGDGLACLAGALVLVAIVWATAWSSVRNAAIRAEALRRLGEGAWTMKATKRGARS